MTENEAISMMRYRIDTASKILGKGMDGKAYEDLEMAISALKEIQQYREIGTVEECREAVEKQTQKKCAIDSCPDHTHYKCPSCGQIELSIYKHGFPKLGRITKYCENCGQAIRLGENKEGMEDE